MLNKKNVAVVLIVMLTIISFCSLFVYYQKEEDDKKWSVMISEEGAFVEGRDNIPFKYIYLNEKNNVYIFSTSEDIKKIAEEQ